MKNWIKIIGIILLIAIVIFVIYKISTQKEEYFSKFTFEQYHHVYNTTGVAYLDTIIHAGLQTLNIDTVIIIIKPLIIVEEILPEGLITKAYIKGSGHQYIIYIDSMTKDEYITVLSHELIHLEQYYTGKLKINNKYVTWEGNIIDLTLYTYMNRPWEKEAYDNEDEIYSEMKTLLYKKSGN